MQTGQFRQGNQGEGQDTRLKNFFEGEITGTDSSTIPVEVQEGGNHEWVFFQIGGRVSRTKKS